MVAILSQLQYVFSLATGKSDCHFKKIGFHIHFYIYTSTLFPQNALACDRLDLTDDMYLKIM